MSTPPPAPAAERLEGESWLRAFSLSEMADTEWRSRLTDGTAGDDTDDESGLRRHSEHSARLLDGAQRRVRTTYLAARAALGVALLAVQATLGLISGQSAGLSLLICAAYALQALLWWLRPDWSQPPNHDGHDGDRFSSRQWWPTIGVDALVFAALHWLDNTGPLNHAALLVLPVMMSGVLRALVSALATASALSMLLLATAFWRATDVNNFAGQLSQAGLAGIGLFAVALVAGQLAQRMAREERLARGSLELAHQQAELNRVVIDEMSDGVLVVDRQGRVRAANPAARLMLAEDDSCPKVPFSLAPEPGWRSLLVAVESAYQMGQWPTAGMDLVLSHGHEAPRALRVRARFTRGARLQQLPRGAEGKEEPLAVLFVEPLRNVQARQRQERLVAMGRVSAGIAHEIRNPLAAVAQANQLLREDDLRPDQQWLVRIIADNVERLKRIVDDVMEVAPGGSTPSVRLDATAEVAAICAEWARTVGLPLGPDGRMLVMLPATPLIVWFDPEHLRRVLVNLLDNALRHSTVSPGAVTLTLEGVDEGCARFVVANDGELMPPEIERHLFEPFHSSRSRGTGLGLYICRELCERHGAVIDYLRRPEQRHGNAFLVAMRRDTPATPQETAPHA